MHEYVNLSPIPKFKKPEPDLREPESPLRISQRNRSEYDARELKNITPTLESQEAESERDRVIRETKAFT